MATGVGLYTMHVMLSECYAMRRMCIVPQDACLACVLVPNCTFSQVGSPAPPNHTYVAASYVRFVEVIKCAGSTICSMPKNALYAFQSPRISASISDVFSLCLCLEAAGARAVGLACDVPADEMKRM